MIGPWGNPACARPMSRLLLCCAALLLTQSPAAQVQTVQIGHQSLRLNGNLVDFPDRQQAVFLILHGTWAHKDMEIIADLQDRLAEENAASLAITLSLGVDDRRGFLPCEPPIRARHDQAIEELRAWRNHLLDLGWQRIVLLGHSRGGNQVSLYQARYHDPAVVELALLAPPVWEQDAVQEDYRAATGEDLAPLIARARRDPAAMLVVPKLLNCDSMETTGQAFLSYYDRSPEKNTPAVLADFHTPTHIYLGTEDAISDRFEKAYLARGALDHVTLHHVDGAGHFFRDFYLDEISGDLLARRQESNP